MKPCAFCGYDKANMTTSASTRNHYALQCQNHNCRAIGPRACTAEEAQEQWDHRYETPPPYLNPEDYCPKCGSDRTIGPTGATSICCMDCGHHFPHAPKASNP